MSVRTPVRLYEGHHFKLSPEQVESIGDALREVDRLRDTDEMGSLLAQVWQCDDGVYCCCHFVSAGKVRVIQQVLSATDISAVTVEVKPKSARDQERSV